jgi:hypothetical protein
MRIGEHGIVNWLVELRRLHRLYEKIYLIQYLVFIFFYFISCVSKILLLCSYLLLKIQTRN